MRPALTVQLAAAAELLKHHMHISIVCVQTQQIAATDLHGSKMPEKVAQEILTKNIVN